MFEQITECAEDFVEAVEKEANTRKALDFKEWGQLVFKDWKGGKGVDIQNF